MNQQLKLVDISPRTNLLSAFRARIVGVPRALKELIDNCINAGAKNIYLTLTKEYVEVSDDGCGCDSIAKMLRLGDHTSGTKGNGMYGVGLKLAAIWLGDTLQITTHHRGKKLYARISWAAIERSGVWKIQEFSDRGPSSMVGTAIKISDLNHTQALSMRTDALLADLAFTYFPAIANGTRILFRTSKTTDFRPLSGFSPAELSIAEHREETLNLGSGRTCKIRVGILEPDSENPYPGISFIHKHRVIRPSSSLGCGEYDVSRIFGTAELIGSQWGIGDAKDGFAADLEISVGTEIQRGFSDILQRAGEQAIHARSLALSSKLSEYMNGSIMAAIRPRRNSSAGGSTGSKEATGEGTKHKHATVFDAMPVDGGVKKRRVTPGTILIKLGQLPELEAFRFDGNTLTLNCTKEALKNLSEIELQRTGFLAFCSNTQHPIVQELGASSDNPTSSAFARLLDGFTAYMRNKKQKHRGRLAKGALK